VSGEESFYRRKLFFWIEEYLFYPKKASQKILSYLLLPFSGIYCLIVLAKRAFSKPKDFGLPIISIGNLTIGGNGKTPFAISLLKNQKNSAVILRGYKRKSKGLLKVTADTPVQECGDEALLYASTLPNTLVLVSVDRIKAIEYAKKNGIKSLFLDDAFHKSEIKKLDILLKPSIEPNNNFCIPSGGYREPKSLYKKADIVATEEKDFKREVIIKNPTNKMVLVTAIAKPERLDVFLPEDGSLAAKEYFQDHHFYTKKELEDILLRYDAKSLLVTTKDMVKMKDFDLPLSIMELEVNIDKKIIDKVNDFIDNYGNI
jgi:tetraacyldisaccharide 4'-kinase